MWFLCVLSSICESKYRRKRHKPEVPVKRQKPKPPARDLPAYGQEQKDAKDAELEQKIAELQLPKPQSDSEHKARRRYENMMDWYYDENEYGDDGV